MGLYGGPRGEIKYHDCISLTDISVKYKRLFEINSWLQNDWMKPLSKVRSLFLMRTYLSISSQVRTSTFQQNVRNIFWILIDVSTRGSFSLPPQCATTITIATTETLTHNIADQKDTDSSSVFIKALSTLYLCLEKGPQILSTLYLCLEKGPQILHYWCIPTLCVN